MIEGWSSRFPNSRILGQLMDYITTEAEQASVRRNGVTGRCTFEDGLFDRRKSGQASIDKAVTVGRQIRPYANL